MTDAVLATQPIYCGWFNVLGVRLRLNGIEEQRALIEHVSGASVLLYDPNRRVALVTRQTRDGPLLVGQAPFWEAVTGVTEDEAPEETATREAVEEAGIRPATLHWIGRVWMTPSSTTERVHLFLAEYAPGDRVGAGGGAEDENERIHATEVPLDRLWRLVERANMADAKLFMLLHALRVRRPDLFDGVVSAGG